MPFPARLLNEGEVVVVDVRPHPVVLAGPVGLAVLAVAAGAVIGALFSLPTAVAWVLVVVIALAMIHLLARYLRWQATSLVVTTDRVIRRAGVVSRRGTEIPLSQLTDISYRQSFFDRVIRAGDVLIESAGRDSREVVPALPRPAAIQNEIYRLMSARATVGAPATALSLPEQLEKLANLFQQGLLTPRELEQAKARLLGGG